jgi:hypothetical protein
MKSYLTSIAAVLILVVVTFIVLANYIDCKYSTGGEGENDWLSHLKDRISFICR